MKTYPQDKEAIFGHKYPAGPDGSSIWECWKCREFLATAGTVFNMIRCTKCNAKNRIRDTHFRPPLGPGFC